MSGSIPRVGGVPLVQITSGRARHRAVGAPTTNTKPSNTKPCDGCHGCHGGHGCHVCNGCNGCAREERLVELEEGEVTAVTAVTTVTAAHVRSDS